MKKISKKTKCIIIVILLIIEIILCYIYFKNSSNSNNFSTNFNIDNIDMSEISNNISNDNTESSTIVNTTAEVTSALTENIELHTTYYLEECYVEEDDEISSGENILKYTNDTYLTAPYDCVINSLSIPEEGEECNNNYIQISSTSLLSVTISVDESTINQISLGQEAEITISAYEDKVLTGYVTSISNTAQNGYFTVVIEFDNDGDVKLGMTAEVKI